MQAKKQPIRGVKLFMYGFFALLVLVLTFVGVMKWLGYALIDVSMEFALFGLLLVSALIAGAVWLTRRFSSRGARIATGSICTLVILALSLLLLSMSNFLMATQMPMQYTVLTAPDGRAAVVLRQLSASPERMEARFAARGEEMNADQVSIKDFGYRYTAHPRVARFFYNEKCVPEGELEIGCASEAQLMYEWTQEDELRLYVENAVAGDGGELRLKLG